MARILVTGASGFLGRPCVTALGKAGHDVIALGRQSDPSQSALETIRCDIFDPQALGPAVRAAKADCLIHCAWATGPASRWVSLTNRDWIPVTVELARVFAEAGGKRFVFAGSCAEYDWSHDLLSETATPLRPSSVYGAAKAETGLALSAAAETLGLSFAWARIFFCYGPGEPRGRLVSDLVSALAAGETIACTDGEQERDFLHSADVAAALALIATSAIEGPVNVGSGQAVAVKDIIHAVCALVGDLSQVEFGARARPADDPPRLVADISRLRSLGFRQRFDLDAGVRDTVQALLAGRVA